MNKLLHEIHRRSVWQVLGIYLAGSWIALQVVDTLNSTIGLPDWFPGAAFALLAIGLPIVLSTAVVQGGLRPTPDSAPEADPVPSSLESSKGVPVAQASSPTAAIPEPSTAAGFLTWRRAVVGGVGAFALLGFATAGYFISRATGIGPAATLVAQGLIEDQPRILLTQFASPSGDSLLARTATEALRTDLAESPMVTLAEPVFVRDALQRMQRPSSTPLDLEVGRELGQREGIGALVAGELTAVGDGYTISGQIVDVTTGSALVSQRVDAKDANDILRAIDRLSKKLRERMGESLRTIRADPPREQVTTGSFNAFQHYSQALYAEEVEGDTEKAKLLFEEAIRADSTFGMAYLKLGELSDYRSEDVAMTDRAYEMRDGMSDRERFYTIASYHWHRGQWDRATAALESLLAEHPEDGSTLTWVSGMYLYQGELERAEEAARRAVAAPTCGFCSFQALTRAQVALGDFQGAEQTAAQALERIPDHPGSPWLRGVIASSRRDYAAAAAISDSLYKANPDRAANNSVSVRFAAAVSGVRGQIDDAAGRTADYLRAHEETDADTHFSMNRVRSGFELARGDSAAALAILRSAESGYSLDELDPLDRPYLDMAYAYAEAGDAAAARRLMTTYETEVPAEFHPFEAEEVRWSESALQIAEGNFDAAIEALRGNPDIECWDCILQARAHDLAGRADDAIAAYEKYVDTPNLFDLYESQFVLAATYERLGQLYDARDDGQNAVKFYAAFVELWTEADEDLQPRVRVAQARLEEILREIG